MLVITAVRYDQADFMQQRGPVQQLDVVIFCRLEQGKHGAGRLRNTIGACLISMKTLPEITH
ncbi:hypothetical protein D3C72_2433990 [compost metagenome]